jgi:hypothetical protein
MTRGAHITLMAEAVPGILAAISGEGAAVDSCRVSSADGGVLLNACMQRADKVVAVSSSKAESAPSQLDQQMSCQQGAPQTQRA